MLLKEKGLFPSQGRNWLHNQNLVQTIVSRNRHPIQATKYRQSLLRGMVGVERDSKTYDIHVIAELTEFLNGNSETYDMITPADTLCCSERSMPFSRLQPEP